MKMHGLRKQQGAELVEFAISATLLFVLLFGIIEFSVALFDKATITNAGREGARTGILFRPSPRDISIEDEAIRNAVDQYAEAYLISLGGSASMDIDITRTDLDGDGSFDAGDELTVSVTYPYQFLVMPAFLADIGGGIDLSSTIVMRAE